MKYHLIAIGGTGMGALAGLLHAAGHDVRGSDGVLYPPMSEQLAALQIPVFQGFAAENLSWQPDVVVVGNVCRMDHVEVLEARRLGLPLTSLPALLGEQIIADRHSLVVTGTHGKTTTSSLLAHILISAGRDPGVFVGGVPINMGQGFQLGGGPEFVVEGDEYDSAFFDKGPKFLHYRPRTAIITSLEFDHADIFASIDQVRDAFRSFISLVPGAGLLVVCASSPEAMALARAHAQCPVQSYAVLDDGTRENELEQVTWVASEITYTKSGRCRFHLSKDGALFDRYESLLIGRHNVGNAVAAIAVAHSLGLDPNDIRRGLSGFAGVKRRQEVCGIAQGVYVLDDYAHHPTAVAETLCALGKRFQRRRLLAVFEPRSATSRLKIFQDEYARSFGHADMVIVGPLYAPDAIPPEERLDPQKLALDIHNSGIAASHIPNVDGIVKHLVSLVRPGDVVVVLSSGSFDGLHNKLLAALGDAMRPATRQDMSDIRTLAKELSWPSEHLGDETFPLFLVLHNETGFVGCVALEVYGEAAILHSLAVTRKARGVGYGWLLADTAVQVARHRGVKRIYLLTQDAGDFFAVKLGFRVVDVSTVSAAVADSTTFRDQRGGAIAMRLDL